MVEDEKVLEKIRRLFELAKSSNEHESAAAAAKAQELLQKYNLSMSQIPNGKKEAYVKDTVRLKNPESWAKTLYHTVAKNNNCKVVILSDGQIAVIGQRHNLEIVEYLYSQLETRIRKLSEAAWDLYGEGREGIYKRDFALGAISRLDVRLKRQVEVFTQTSPESTALVVTSGRELSQAVKHWFPHLRTSYGPTVGAGYGLGQAAGATMGINAGLAGGANSVRRLK